MSDKPIGILGGMGPGAGVYFKQLIVSLTPSKRDQDHIPMVVYTNPQIPDRTTAIVDGVREEFIAEVCDSLRKLDTFGVSELFIPCNTSFVGYSDYQAAVSTPIYHLPERTLEAVELRNCKSTFLLATSGTYLSKVYQSRDGLRIDSPSEVGQASVHQLISAVKANDFSSQQRLFPEVVQLLPARVESVILGCTELSMLAGQFRLARPDVDFVDPLEVAAQHIICTYAPQLTAVS